MINSLSCVGAFRLPRRGSLARLLLLIGTALATSNVAASTYRIVLLPPPPGTDARSLQPVAINNAAEVVGYGYRDAYPHAITWSTGPDHAPRWLPEGDARSSKAFGINDDGYIVGQWVNSSASGPAVMWFPNDVPVLLHDSTNPYLGSYAFAINNSRSILGYASTRTGTAPAFWARPAAGPREIPDGQFISLWPEALNNQGAIVGYGLLPADHGQFHYRAFRSMPRAGRQLLAELPFAGPDVNYYARDVNEAGEVVGEANGLSTPIAHVVKWKADGSVLDLGDLPGGSDYFYSACCINNAGVVAGSFMDTRDLLDFQAFAWTPAEGMHSIVDLIDPFDPLYPEIASGTPIDIRGINDAGVMVGILDPINWSRPILLVPTRAKLPLPSPDRVHRAPDAARK